MRIVRSAGPGRRVARTSRMLARSSRESCGSDVRCARAITGGTAVGSIRTKSAPPLTRVSVSANVFRTLFVGLLARTVDSCVSPEIATCVPASFFDVDGTLVRTNLVHPTVFYLANQHNPLRSLGVMARAALGSPRMALAEMLDRRRFNELLFAAYKGMSEDRLHILADEAFDTVLRRAIYPGARDLVQRCRAQGQDVVLVS